MSLLSTNTKCKPLGRGAISAHKILGNSKLLEYIICILMCDRFLMGVLGLLPLLNTSFVILFFLEEGNMNGACDFTELGGYDTA